MALAATEAELAGVNPHESGHVTARHTAERLSQAQLAQLGVGLIGIITGSSAAASAAGQGVGIFIQQFLGFGIMIGRGPAGAAGGRIDLSLGLGRRSFAGWCHV